jgi:hypothetical protein
MEHGIATWQSEAWLADATAWVDAHVTRTGPLELGRLRPWAGVWKVPSEQGLLWLKAMSPVTGFEAALYPLLVRAAPGAVLEPVAVDVERGRLLLPDGGTPLPEAVPRDELLAAMATELRRYGELQRAVAPHADALVALGVPDMRVARLPARLDEACAKVAPWADAHGTPDERATLARVAAMGDEVRAWCDALAALPGEASIDHNDLHPFNVLVGADGRRIVYDWGDSAVAHPFTSLLVVREFFVRELRATPADLDVLRDAYLGAFADLGEHAALVRAVELACRLANIARALTWHRLLDGLDGMADGFARAPYDCLATLTAGAP